LKPSGRVGMGVVAEHNADSTRAFWFECIRETIECGMVWRSGDGESCDLSRCGDLKFESRDRGIELRSSIASGIEQGLGVAR